MHTFKVPAAAAAGNSKLKNDKKKVSCPRDETVSGSSLVRNLTSFNTIFLRNEECEVSS